MVLCIASFTSKYSLSQTSNHITNNATIYLVRMIDRRVSEYQMLKNYLQLGSQLQNIYKYIDKLHIYKLIINKPYT